jgi:hypothetical protein
VNQIALPTVTLRRLLVPAATSSIAKLIHVSIQYKMMLKQKKRLGTTWPTSEYLCNTEANDGGYVSVKSNM